MLVDARMGTPEHQVDLEIILQQIVVACLVRQHQVVLDIILREVCLQQENLCALMLQPRLVYLARICLGQTLT